MRLFLPLALFLTAYHGYCAPGWYKTYWGMPHKEAIDSLKLDSVKSIDRIKIKDSEYSDLGIEKFNTAGIDFSVSLVFNNATEKLSSVGLTLIKGASSEKYFLIKSKLSGKYGAPVFVDERKNNALKKSTWSNQGTIIEVTYLKMDELEFTPEIKVTYKPELNAGL